MMKKWTAFILVLICALSLTACGEKDAAPKANSNEESHVSDPVQEESPVPNPWGITLTAEDVTATGMTIVCTHAGEAPGGELQTGSPFWLERRADGAWEKVPYILPEEQIAWDMLAYLIPLNDSTRWEVNWTWLYGELPLGEVYRLGKEIQLFRGPGDYESRAVYTDEFAFVD